MTILEYFFFVGIPEVPGELMAIPDTTTILFSWSAPSPYRGPITHYELTYYCEETGDSLITNTSATTWRVTGLKPEKEFVAQVRAFTTAGSGDYSDPITTTTLPVGK